MVLSTTNMAVVKTHCCHQECLWWKIPVPRGMSKQQFVDLQGVTCWTCFKYFCVVSSLAAWQPHLLQLQTPVLRCIFELGINYKPTNNHILQLQWMFFLLILFVFSNNLQYIEMKTWLLWQQIVSFTFLLVLRQNKLDWLCQLVNCRRF